MKKSLALATLAWVWAAGCSLTQGPYAGEKRLAKGLVVILPGIEGAGRLSRNIRSGLDRGGVKMGLSVYNWGRPIPIAGPLLNQMDVLGNRLAAARIARKITEFQDCYPDCPVYLVGHSGGGGVAVFVAEALPEDRRVEGIVLLSASISKHYDLRKALSRCEKGIVSFYSGNDVALLVVGTTLMGNVDGIRGPAAGAFGFDKPAPRLYQVPWQEEMARTGNNGHHADTAARPFVTRYVAPWLTSFAWPPPGEGLLVRR